jgi:hypothetical protein
MRPLSVTADPTLFFLPIPMPISHLPDLLTIASVPHHSTRCYF